MNSDKVVLYTIKAENSGRSRTVAYLGTTRRVGYAMMPQCHADDFRVQSSLCEQE